MKKDNNFKANIKYFTKGEKMKYIGLGLVVASASIYFLALGWGIWAYIILTLGLPTGIVMFLLSTGRASDSEIREYITIQKRGVGDEVFDEKNFRKRQHAKIEPMVFEGFVYNKDVMIQKAKNGNLMTSEYEVAVIYPLNDGIHISHKWFSIISEDSRFKSFEIKYSDITCFEPIVETKEISFLKNTFNPTSHLLKVSTVSGEEFMFPSEDTLNIDIFIKNIKETIEKHKAE